MTRIDKGRIYVCMYMIGVFVYAHACFTASICKCEITLATFDFVLFCLQEKGEIDMRFCRNKKRTEIISDNKKPKTSRTLRSGTQNKSEKMAEKEETNTPRSALKQPTAQTSHRQVSWFLTNGQ